MKITLKFLKKINTCSKDIEFMKENKLIGLEALDLIEKLIELNKPNLANWFIIRVLDKNKIGLFNYVVFAIEQFIDTYEKEYPDNNHLRKAIESVKVWIKNPCQETSNSMNNTIRNTESIITESRTWSTVVNSAWGAALVVSWGASWSIALSVMLDMPEPIDTPSKVALTTAWSIVSKMICDLENIDESNNITYNKMLKKIINNGIVILKGEK
jgi:hypothetical protein